MDKFKELLKELGIDEEVTTKIIDGMKEGKLYLSESEEENLDIRYRELKKKYDALKLESEKTPETPPQEPVPEPTPEPQTAEPNAETQRRIEELEAENKRLRLDDAIKLELLAGGAKASDIDYLLFKIRQLENVGLSETGKLEGVDVEDMKKLYPSQFSTKPQRKVDVLDLPPAGDPPSISREQFDKMSYEERLKLKQKDPEAYGDLRKGE